MMNVPTLTLIVLSLWLMYKPPKPLLSFVITLCGFYLPYFVRNHPPLFGSFWCDVNDIAFSLCGCIVVLRNEVLNRSLLGATWGNLMPQAKERNQGVLTPCTRIPLATNAMLTMLVSS